MGQNQIRILSIVGWIQTLDFKSLPLEFVFTVEADEGVSTKLSADARGEGEDGPILAQSHASNQLLWYLQFVVQSYEPYAVSGCYFYT